MTTPDTKELVERTEWLIRKGGYFYRPNKAGYTTKKYEAGRYTKADAEREATIESWHMNAIHQDEWPDDPVSARIEDMHSQNVALATALEAMQRERDEARAVAAVGAEHSNRLESQVAALKAEVEGLREALQSAKPHLDDLYNPDDDSLYEARKAVDAALNGGTGK